MGKLYFYHGTMASGKSAYLLMKIHQFEKNGCGCALLKPSIDTRNEGVVSSRIGIERNCININTDANVHDILRKLRYKKWITHVFIDEVQFLTEEQAIQLWKASRDLDIRIFCFGLKTTYKNTLFDTTKTLFVYADTIEEMKSMCQYCPNKATTHLLLNNGKPILGDIDTIIEDTENNEFVYTSVCQDCYKSKINAIITTKAG